MAELIANRNYYEGLSVAEWDRAESIESEINKIVRKGFTEDVAVLFVRTVMEIQAAIPDATVGGIFNTALIAGLLNIKRRVVAPANKPTRKRKSTLSGAGV